MVLDNQVAKLQVGDAIPFNTGSLNTGVSTGNSGVVAATTVSYQQTGVVMQILPHVNSSGLVTLDIAQDVSDVVPGTQTTGSPSFTERNVTTRVVVQDGQTVGIAGLITDQSSEGNSGIPYLKDIPILGSIFSQQNNVRTRKELLVMITPHVIQDQRDALKLTEDLRESLPHAGLVPQQLKELPLSGSANPNAVLTN
jgi:general secretion pathway protein D